MVSVLVAEVSVMLKTPPAKVFLRCNDGLVAAAMEMKTPPVAVTDKACVPVSVTLPLPELVVMVLPDA